MAEMNRWKVTYTKHLKQRRKVYHDGFLDVHRSSNKTMLYDECEKLLECRILKQEEVVCSGETLIFNSYLVEIDTPLGDNKPESGLNFQAGHDEISEKSGVLRGKNFRNNSVCFENKASAEKNKTRPTLSPSCKIIREFKKSRLKCYGSPQTSPDTRQTEETEWQVLYTSNITQKAKKYHDGFLKLLICGSLGRQVMLFDENRKLLDSRFMKKDERVKSGESIAFDAHLVDIGECEREHKPPKIPVSQGSSFGDRGTRVLHEPKKCFSENEISTGKEWHVLYTSQITQKSKKYHNGIIKISSSGSHHMQVTLLNEDRIILSSKHISLSKKLGMGEILELPKYLVEIGEACENVKVELANRDFDIRKDASFCISGEDEKGSARATMKKSLRDAHEILSILQRPKARVSLSSGQSDKNISVSVSSSKVPEPSLATEALDLPMDERSHQKPSENLDTRESTKNAESNQSFALTQSTLTELEIGHSNQLLQTEYVEAESSSLRDTISWTQGTSQFAACKLVNDEGKMCEEITYERETVHPLSIKFQLV
ncbi:protein ZGRF1 isoform X1 [Cucurbita maxima]|uniref:Protein ZGRF1 isoform X1 n=1 Tax=Cucurbita maxima TaxID=3661 RepID=A0A6J1I2N0_CUCMA|nr:protein ZGRF1 isoform X1 [Cucurbita maxima]